MDVYLKGITVMGIFALIILIGDSIVILRIERRQQKAKSEREKGLLVHKEE